MAQKLNSWLDKLGIEPQFKDGLRVTDAATMDVVEMVLVGRVNKEIVALINQAGGLAVGLCGKDGNLFTARPQGQEGIGFVGEVSNVNIKILDTLASNGYIPVVSSVPPLTIPLAINSRASRISTFGIKVRLVFVIF